MDYQDNNVKKTNGFAIAGFVLSILCGGFLALIFCIIGLANAKKYNSGKGLSIAGLIILAVKVVLVIVYFVFFSAVLLPSVADDLSTSLKCSLAYGCEKNSKGTYTCKYDDADGKTHSINCSSAYVTDYDIDDEEDEDLGGDEVSPLVGYYDCKGVTSSGDYTLSMEFEPGNFFRYGAYDDLDNNHYSGTFTAEHESEKDGKVAGYKYYNVTLNYNKDDFVKDGVLQEWPSTNGTVGKAEIGINDSGYKKQAVFIFTNTYNTYACTAR